MPRHAVASREEWLHWLDRVPAGRNEGDAAEVWLRRADEYR